ncbi:MAG: hypothetical protein MJB12_02540, partial [Firmicutes bacterium]|nr:hypothetical protein [Bacillota bacterium]
IYVYTKIVKTSLFVQMYLGVKCAIFIQSIPDQKAFQKSETYDPWTSITCIMYFLKRPLCK